MGQAVTFAVCSKQIPRLELGCWDFCSLEPWEGVFVFWGFLFLGFDGITGSSGLFFLQEVVRGLGFFIFFHFFSSFSHFFSDILL